jgi:hypothetical protein
MLLYIMQNSVLNLRTVFDSVDTTCSGYIDAQQWRAAVGHIAGTLQNGQQVLWHSIALSYIVLMCTLFKQIH